MGTYLNHFTQPDSIVPDPYNSQDWNRYAYARNNPLKYTDPTGHKVCDGAGINGACDQSGIPGTLGQLNSTLKSFGVKSKGSWAFEDLYQVYLGVVSVGEKIARTVGDNAQSAFKEVFTSITFEWMDQTCEINGNTCYADAYQPGTIRVWASYWSVDAEGNRFIKRTPVTSPLIVHELGHKFNVAAGRGPENHVANYDGNHDGIHELTETRNGFASGYTFGQDNTASEIFADMFMGWVYGAWNLRVDPGRTRSNVMTTNMADWILDAQNGR